MSWMERLEIDECEGCGFRMSPDSGARFTLHADMNVEPPAFMAECPLCQHQTLRRMERQPDAKSAMEILTPKGDDYLPTRECSCGKYVQWAVSLLGPGSGMLDSMWCTACGWRLEVPRVERRDAASHRMMVRQGDSLARPGRMVRVEVQPNDRILLDMGGVGFYIDFRKESNSLEAAYGAVKYIGGKAHVYTDTGPIEGAVFPMKDASQKG